MSIYRGTPQSTSEAVKVTRQKVMFFCVCFGIHHLCSGVSDQLLESTSDDSVLPWTAMNQSLLNGGRKKIARLLAKLRHHIQVSLDNSQNMICRSNRTMSLRL